LFDRKAYAKKYYKKYRKINRKRYNKYSEKHRQKIRCFLNDIKSNGCAICGYNKHIKILHFHHVTKKYKKFNVDSGTVGMKQLINEIDKCVILCANCHYEMHLIENGEIKK